MYVLLIGLCTDKVIKSLIQISDFWWYWYASNFKYCKSFSAWKKKRIAILHFKWCNNNASLSDSVSTAFDVKKLDLEVVGILKHFQQHCATHHSGTFGKMTSYLNKNVLSYNFHKFKLLLYFLCTLWVNVLSLYRFFFRVKAKGYYYF